MNLNTILEDLCRECEQIKEDILSLERLTADRRTHRGNTRAWLKAQKIKVRISLGGKEPPWWRKQLRATDSWALPAA